MTFGYYEFFAGGGMARAGLGSDWTCLFANDIDPKKAFSYTTNWGEQQVVVRDVAHLKLSELQGIADLVWALISLPGSFSGAYGSGSRR